MATGDELPNKMVYFTQDELMLIDRALHDRIDVLPVGVLSNREAAECHRLRGIIAPYIEGPE